MNDPNDDGKHRYEQSEVRYRGYLRKADMLTPKLTAEIINAAIEGFESQKRRIDDQIAELRAMLPDSTDGNASATVLPGRKRRKLTAAARKRMKEAQQRRWAKFRGESESLKAEPAKPKRKLSAAAKAKLLANLKKARAAKAAKAKSAVKQAAPSRKKAAKAVKRAAAKKTAPAPTTTQAAG